MNAISEWDIGILDWIASHLQGPFLDFLSPVLSFLGEIGWFWIALTLVLLLFKKTRKTGLYMAAAIIIGTILANGILKPAIARIRPWVYLELYHPEHPPIEFLNGIVIPKDYSFPSGHTTNSIEAAFALFLGNKKLGIPALVLAVGIAFSRLYLYMHYLTDVLGGIVIGIVSAVLGVLAVNAILKWVKKAREKKNKTPSEEKTEDAGV